MLALIRISAVLSLALLVLSGCGRMRSAEWTTGGNRINGDSSGPSNALQFKSLKAASNRSCAITEGGALYCWGDNTSAQVTTPPEWSFQHVVNASGIPAITLIDSAPMSNNSYDPALHRHILSISTQSQANHLCMIVSNGSPSAGDVVCLGKPDPEQILGGASSDGVVPSPNGIKFSQVKTGIKVTCALSEDGELYCSGVSASLPGGVASTLTRLQPGLPLPQRVLDFAVGDDHICTILQNEQLYCWGFNSEGQLGPNAPALDSLRDYLDGTLPHFDTSIEGQSINQFSKVYASDTQTCAIATNEQIYCWGKNLGPPRRASNVGWRVQSATLGHQHNCLIYNEATGGATGRVACAGANGYGQLGTGTTDIYFPSPPTGDLVPVTKATDLLPLENVTQIGVGPTHTCAITVTNHLWCWGRNASFFEIDQETEGVYPRAFRARSHSNAGLVAAGRRFTCVVRIGDELTCVGVNIFQAMQEPNNSEPTFRVFETILGPYQFGSSAPTPPGFSPEVRPMSANSGATCASERGEGGRLYCWGTFWDPSLPSQPRLKTYPNPIPIPGLEAGVSSVSVGGSHACAIQAGALYCWGQNLSGQVNGKWSKDPSTSPIVAPVLLFSSGVSAVSAGDEHTCAVVAGDLLCWGKNTFGQVGANRRSDYIPYPVRVLTGDVIAVAAGHHHTCAIKGPNPPTVYCWGISNNGQLGNNSGGNYLKPTAITPDLSPDLLGYIPVEIAAGAYHTCIKALEPVTGEHHLLCAGLNDALQIGLDGGITQQNTFVRVPGSGNLSSVSPITAKASQTCYVQLVGTGPTAMAYCAGDNRDSQHGTGHPTESSASTHVGSVFPAGPIHVAPGFDVICLSSGGQVLCAGSNRNAQLGNGTTYNRILPTPHLVFPEGIAEVALGDDHTCALHQDQTLFCWGNNASSQLPIASKQEWQTDPRGSPVSGITHVAASGNATCFSNESGEVRCIGANANGVIAQPNTVPSVSFSSATPIMPSGNVTDLTMGEQTACAVVNDELKCWGNNSSRQIGPDSIHHPQSGWVTDPFIVHYGVKQVAITATEICYLTSSDQLQCSTGVGLAHEINQASLTQVTRISSQSGSVCGVNSSGELFCGGLNPQTTLNPSDPALSLPFGKIRDQVTLYSVSPNHGCGVLAGVLKCWGDDSWGQLGDGGDTLIFLTTPVSVTFNP